MPSIAEISNLSHAFGKTQALSDVTLEIPSGCMVGLIGPDGVGKSTLMGLIAGAKIVQKGSVKVLGGDIADRRHRDVVCPQIAYMPQGLGKNLYHELSVFENLDFFARLFAQDKTERHQRIDTLLKATSMSDFVDRQAGKLSGGMKQKLGLCCALIHDPDLLLLDEPTTGVDPLSRQQFWTLIDRIRKDRPGMSVLVSTAYMDEADRFDWLIAMNAGQVLASGKPQELKTKTGTDNLEATFVALLPESQRGDGQKLQIPERPRFDGDMAIVAKNLTRRFGTFIAVENVSFEIERGEIFGFLGSNGCGKSTTMKMLTGLLPASDGHAELFGKPVETESLETRKRVGYMSQGFSLYGELTVSQNLWLHARLFHLPRGTRAQRIDDLVKQFGLESHFDQLAADLPLGVRQRLSLAVAIIQEPEMLILDEPTSGVDPVARDEFWKLLIHLSREKGVTIFVSTHFMNEALRCDRISLMHAGKVLACDVPQKLVDARGAASLEEVFIQYIAEASGQTAETEPAVDSSETGERQGASRRLVPESNTQSPAASALPLTKSRVGLKRLLAYSYREMLEVRRDPVRLAFAFAGSMVLMFVFGFGITMDVDQIPCAILDYDQSPASREYLSHLEGSRYFVLKSPLRDPDEMWRRLQSNDISVAIEIPPNFGRKLKRGDRQSISALIDGANPSRAATIQGYVAGVHGSAMRQQAVQQGLASNRTQLISIQQRFQYNPTFESIYAMVPAVPSILLMLIPAILMAVSVVREKELGSITNFYVTPTTRLEFLLGKQLPYIVIAFLNFAMLTAMAVFLFGVPIKGSLAGLIVCAALYVTAVTGLGLLISSFTSSQVAAVFVTTVVTILPTVQFSGLMQPVSTLEGGARLMGTLWPTTYYMHASVGAFTKGLPFGEMSGDMLALAAFMPVLTLLTAASLKKQER